MLKGFVYGITVKINYVARYLHMPLKALYLFRYSKRWFVKKKKIPNDKKMFLAPVPKAR